MIRIEAYECPTDSTKASLTKPKPLLGKFSSEATRDERVRPFDEGDSDQSSLHFLPDVHERSDENDSWHM